MGELKSEKLFLFVPESFGKNFPRSHVPMESWGLGKIRQFTVHPCSRHGPRVDSLKFYSDSEAAAPQDPENQFGPREDLH